MPKAPAAVIDNEFALMLFAAFLTAVEAKLETAYLDVRCLDLRDSCTGNPPSE